MSVRSTCNDPTFNLAQAQYNPGLETRGQNRQFRPQSLRFSFPYQNQPTPNAFYFLILLFRSLSLSSSLASPPFYFPFYFLFCPWIPMVTTVKSRRPPHVSFPMSGRRHRFSPAATTSFFRPARSISSSTRGALVALCCLSLVLALSVSAAAEDCAEESDGDGRYLGFRDACADRSSFCFSPSVAQTLLANEDSIKETDLEVSRDWGPSRPLGFPMSGGGVVTCSSVDTLITRARNGLGREGDVRYNVPSCQAPLVPDNWMRASSGVPLELDGAAADVDQSVLHSSLSMNVAINPPVLDWGRSDLYAASTATLTVVNLNNDSALHLYEPFSTDPQFYVYGYENPELQPGDNASVTFIFLPTSLGSSSAHLVLQTNFGGFIIQAKGMAVSSPYQILPLTGIGVVIGGHLERNLSIYNPHDDTLYVEEVAVWMSSLESTRQSSHIVCQLDPFDGPLELTSSSSNWYTASSPEFGWPMIYIRPSEQWEVHPSKSSTVVELKLQALSEGKVFGAICLKLRNCTADPVDTIVIPIELEVHKQTYYDSSGLVAVTFERVSSCGESGSIFSLSLRNDASKLLRIVGVTEDNRNGPVIFQVKYLSGLILFPDTVTDIALIRHTSVPEDISFNSCNIVVETNSTLDSSITIPCEDLVHASLSHTTSAVFAESDGSFTGPLYEEEISANARTRSLSSMLQVEGLNNVKRMIMRTVKADDIILRQWRAHGTKDGISVLMDHELMFPVVQIGSQFSKWITIHNPSMDHAAMQLILNSEEMIDQCKTVNDACECAFSSRSPEIDSTETRFGFSLSDAAITEAYVGPWETALLGPVVFRPSNGCMWSSMVLIRNNLSGVEMLPLRAHGGRQSIVLLEGSEPVWKLEFNLGSHVQNKSTLSKSEVPSPLCRDQLSKEIHVKNSGDLPLQVTKVKISGADCGVDGFTVDNCKGFNLAPSESIRMLISFQADFSSAMVQRDLELTMSTGIFVIPMTANIPVCMLSQCRKSYLRSIHWKWLVLFFGAVTILVLIFVRNVPHSWSVGSQDYYTKIDDRKSSMNKTVKPPFLQHSNKKSRSIREHRRAEEALTEKYPASVLDSSKMTNDKNNPDEQLNTTSIVSVSPANPVEDKASRETPQTSENLTIRISRDRGKRRKRKVGGTGLAAKFEVSSSHSGNSTPSSPLSPSLTPKQGWTFSGAPSELKHESKLESGFDVEATTASTGTKHKKTWLQAAKDPPTPSATPGNTLPSAAVLTTAWRAPLLATSSPIALHARAPGSNLMKDKVLKRDEGAAPIKEFTYDIWGDHFPGTLLGRAREAAPRKMFDASEGASYSFFAREPQALMMKPSPAPPVSRGCGSPTSDVASGYGIK
ncbi:uncharacterized protein LOC133916800 [Phragmites australis]|uniref:uncharacterized protein LOC133916800 n=1 Tax=Phragmites australis TaxID=29695 RepID=UPI002D764C0A|nr:uncharacterized protein LOC133916800 [Phragmites australis]